MQGLNLEFFGGPGAGDVMVDGVIAS